MTEKHRPLKGVTVVSFESRRHAEMAKLIEKQGGSPISAPSMQEIPLSDQSHAIAFAKRLLGGDCDVLILLTGVGTKILLAAMETVGDRATILSRLQQTTLVCRGPKPQAILKQLQLVPRVVAPEPNTSHELLTALDAELSLSGKRVFVQEYGVSNEELLTALERRALSVERLPVYGWKLPDDAEPLRQAAQLLLEPQVGAAVFTSARQIDHLMAIAAELGIDTPVRAALRERVVIASVGPVTTAALNRHGIAADTHPPRPKMGHLIVHLGREWPRLRGKGARATQS